MNGAAPEVFWFAFVFIAGVAAYVTGFVKGVSFSVRGRGAADEGDERRTTPTGLEGERHHALTSAATGIAEARHHGLTPAATEAATRVGEAMRRGRKFVQERMVD